MNFRLELIDSNDCVILVKLDKHIACRSIALYKLVNSF